MSRLSFDGRAWAKRPIFQPVASRYVRQISIRPGDRIVIVARISNDENPARLHRQITAIREFVEAAGGIVVETRTRVGPTWGRDHYQFIREIARFCKRHDCKPVAETADRWCRSFNYTKYEQDWIPGSGEFGNLLEAAEGVQLYTLHDPDLSPREVRSLHTKGGHKRTGNRGGRPRKRRGKYRPGRKSVLVPIIRDLLRQGLSQREIARTLDVPQCNISRWLNMKGACLES